MAKNLAMQTLDATSATARSPGMPPLAAAPARVVCKQVVGRGLDPSSLDAHGATFTIPPYAGMADGDRVTLYFDYGGNSQGEVHVDIGQAWVGRPITLRIQRAALQAATGKWASVRYGIEPAAGGGTVLSDALDLWIGADVLLAAPRVIDAVAGYLNVTSGADSIDSDDLGDDVIDVRIAIPLYRGMTAGDAVWLEWDETPNEGHFRDRIDIPAVRETVLLVPGESVRACVGQSVAVRYVVLRNGVTEQSQVVVVRVGTGDEGTGDDDVDPGTLVAPLIKQAVDGALDPDQSTRGAVLEFGPYASIRSGDRVHVYWGEVDAPGSYAWICDVTDRYVTQPYPLHVSHALLTAWRDMTVPIYYEVALDDGNVKRSAVRRVRIGRAQSSAPPLPQASVDGVRDGKLDPDDCASGAVVRIPASAALRERDEVTVTWRSASAATNTNVRRVVSLVDVGRDLLIRVPASVVAAGASASAAAVAVSWKLRRTGATATTTSPVTYLTLARAPGNGALTVMGARYIGTITRASRLPRRLSAFDTTTRRRVAAQWRYDDAALWTTAESFRDTRPWAALRVRALGDWVVVRPANVAFTGTDTAAPGTPANAAFVARLDRGNPIGWGDAAYGANIPPTLITYDDVAELSATQSAFAVRRHDGRVAVWGNEAQGGTYATAATVTDARCIVGNGTAFALLRASGAVSAWGAEDAGATVPANIAALRDLVNLYASSASFAGLRSTGQVVAWGSAGTGAQVPADIGELTDIEDVICTLTAFAARRGNGSVVAWGAAESGGVVPDRIAARRDIVELAAATAGAVCVLTSGAQVLAWGDAAIGATVPPEISEQTDIEEVVATADAFCARRRNGSVVAWGGAANGGVVPMTIAALRDIVQVSATSSAFAALRSDGSVVAWGNAARGGDVTAVHDTLLDVRAIYGNAGAFAAVLANGGIVSWGEAAGGGTSTAAAPVLDTGLTYTERVS
ncbi:regulator of chromosome condensation (RCC1) repeat family protein [Burkholderia humptydooensis]|nr:MULTISPECIES: hypothetical protein [Burkholderia]AJY40276.1 regulator of chromosome condensation (RCC1) repeat family protein [Burkholderia sp. 2002721687]